MRGIRESYVRDTYVRYARLDRARTRNQYLSGTSRQPAARIEGERRDGSA